MEFIDKKLEYLVFLSAVSLSGINFTNLKQLIDLPRCMEPSYVSLS